MIFSSTVLPQPLSPMIAKVCWRGTDKPISRSTCWRPKAMLRSCSSMRAVSLGELLRFVDAITHFAFRLTKSNLQRLRPNHVLHVIKRNTQHQIENDDNHERQHEGRGRSATNAFGTGRTVETSITAHQCDCGAEEHAFE